MVDIASSMVDITSSEQLAFKETTVSKLINEVIETHLKDKRYDEKKVAQWVSNICESAIQKLYQLKNPFKYVVTCVISQRTGSALHSATACFWDTVSDGSKSILWPKRNSRDPLNQTMFCIVTVFAVSFSAS